MDTNSVFKTGAGFRFAGFHAENYGSPDVPAILAFWCASRRQVGGETGLINMVRVYADLPRATQAKLESKPHVAVVWPLSAIARRYRLTSAQARHLCASWGFRSQVVDGSEFVLLWKPNVYLHPMLRRSALLVDFPAAIPRLKRHLRRSFRDYYAGPAWGLHRLLWELEATRFGGYASSRMTMAAALLRGLRRPAALLHVLEENWDLGAVDRIGSESRLNTLLSERELGELASAMREHFTPCDWQLGDLLLVDNLQMLHSGMPGIGSRKLGVMLCNRLDLKFPVVSGLVDAVSTEGGSSFEQQVQSFSRAM